MLVFFTVLRGVLHSKKMEKVKPLSLHIGLFIFIFVYAFVGGLLFSYIERSEVAQQQAALELEQKNCVLEKLESADPNVITAGISANRTAAAIADCFKQEVDIRSQWGFVTGTLFGFGIITTLGYNRIAPISLEGRLLCVIYGLIGIPITLILIASIGQFVGGIANIVKKKAISFKFLSINFNRQSSKTKLDEEAGGKAEHEEEEEETSTGVIGLALLAGFLVYMAAGALLLPALNGEFDFLNGIYYVFLVLTAIDFGALVPRDVELLPITFLYVCIGLAITTIAIDIGSEYMRKLHHLGQKLKGVATTKIRFGGKTLKVRDLLHSVGHKCGVDPALIDNLDLENIVERAVAIREGREPPPDTNDAIEPPREPSPPPPEEPEKPPSPDRDIEKEPLLTRKSTSLESVEIPLKNSVIETISHSFERTPSIEMPPPTPPPPFDLCNFVAIDVDLPDDQALRERVNEFEESVVVSRPLEETVAAHIDMPCEAPKPVVLRDSEPIRRTPEKSGEDEPKAFLEKKQKYGRDAKKLYDTYKEEWGRMERLGQKRLGSRRRSVLSPPNEKNGASKSANPSRVTSPDRATSPRPTSRGPSSMPGASTSTPPRRASLLPNSPRASPMSSPKAIRSPSKGAVAAAKEALERRLSANLNTSPLPGKRFF